MAESTVLLEFVGSMKVRQLAELVGMTVDELAATVLRAPGSPDSSPSVSSPASAATPRPALAPQGSGARAELAQPMPTRSQLPLFDGEPGPTLKEIHDALDRWLIGEALEQTHDNITHVADRLGIGRKRVRARWAKVRSLGTDDLDERLGRVHGSTPPPSRDELRGLQTHAAVHDAVDRWLLSEVFAQEGGNVTATARRLVISRRNLRERWARVQPA